MIRLVATDMDGTLLDAAGGIDDRTAAAVAGARRAGIHVVPVTGRPPEGLWHLAERAGLGPLGVCSNGAATVDLEAGTVLATRTLAPEIAARLADAVRTACPGILLAVDVPGAGSEAGSDAGRFFHEPGFFGRELEAWDETVLEVPDVAAALGPSCYKLIARLPGTSPTALIGRLEDAIGEEGHATTSGLDWVDIGAPGVTKAYAMEGVCDRLGIGVEEVVAVGDNHNDLPLLGWAGMAMAPANAVPEVLALVGRVLPHHDDHGVAVLLEELARDRRGSPGRRRSTPA